MADETGPHGQGQDAAASDDEHSFAPPNDLDDGGSSTGGQERMDANKNGNNPIPYLSKEELELVAKGKRPAEVSETVSACNGENLAADNKDLRAHHIRIERKRRDQMRDLFGELQSFMPQVPGQKKTKVATVDQAFNFIQSVKKMLYMLEKRKQEAALARQAASPSPAPPHIALTQERNAMSSHGRAAAFSSSAPPQIALTQGMVSMSSDIVPHVWPDVLLAGATQSSTSVSPQITVTQEIAAGAALSSSSAPPQIALAQDMMTMSSDIVPHGCWPDVLLAAGAGAAASSSVPPQIAVASSSSAPPQVGDQGMAAMSSSDIVRHDLHELLPRPLAAAMAMPAPQLLPPAMPSDVPPPPPPPPQPLAVAAPAPPLLLVGFQTWSWPNLVLSIVNDNAYITVRVPRHLCRRTLVMVPSVLDKYGIDVVIMLVSSDTTCSTFSITAHVAGGTGAENPLSPAEVCQFAVSEMLIWLSSN